jgi:hypothetical protein
MRQRGARRHREAGQGVRHLAAEIQALARRDQDLHMPGAGKDLGQQPHRLTRRVQQVFEVV